MNIRKAQPADRDALVEIWLRSVRATHHFLSEADIESLLPVVRDVALAALELWVLCADDDAPVGFLGLADAKVEALFLAPEFQRRGGGRMLLEHARQLKGALTVDANEQNPAAVRFYEACGFMVVGRSETDGGGRPFTLLHMREITPASGGVLMNKIIRRGMSTLVLLIVLLAGSACPLLGAAGEPEAIAAIDAHTHFYDPSRPQGVPWPSKADKLLYRTVLPAEFKALTKKHGIAGTIVVEASPWLEDNQWLLDLAAKDPFIVGVVGNLDVAGNDFPRHLQRFAANPIFRGIRINHVGVRKALEQPRLQAHLRLLAKHDRVLDVNGGPDLPADAARLARLLPELRIVINHAANLPIDGKAVPKQWLAGMCVAAAEKNVYCKVSALAEATRRTKRDAPTDVAYYRPVLDALWATFGEDRLIYGSNWPVSENAASYATVHGIVDAYFRQRGRAAAEKFFHKNAVAAYKLGERR